MVFRKLYTPVVKTFSNSNAVHIRQLHSNTLFEGHTERSKKVLWCYSARYATLIAGREKIIKKKIDVSQAMPAGPSEEGWLEARQSVG